MNKIAQRLLVFALGIPLALLLALAEFYHHLPLQITMIVFSLLGAEELYKIFRKCGELPSMPFLLIMDAVIMASPYILYLFAFPTHYVCYVYLLCVMVIAALEAVKRGEGVSFEYTAIRVGLSMLLLFYCGYLFSFMSRLSLEYHASKYLLLFLVIVFICDSCAWFFGVLFGKGNRHIVAASPNKSAAGFFGGIAGSIAASVICRCAMPMLFSGSVGRYVLLAFIVSIAAIMGDLVESVFKRSAGVKDSGHLMLGRGGILDSIDSILFSVPVYYLLVRHLI